MFFPQRRCFTLASFHLLPSLAPLPSSCILCGMSYIQQVSVLNIVLLVHTYYGYVAINYHASHTDTISCWPAEFCENLLNSAGVRFAGPIAILRNWTFCLFYVMAELWGSVVVSLLFWGFANQVSVRAFITCMRLLLKAGCYAEAVTSSVHWFVLCSLRTCLFCADHHSG